MKHIINYWENSLSYGFGSRKHYAISAGLGAMIAGLASATAAGVGSGLQYSTNSKNANLTREGWKLQTEEAERAREFNSEEAEKAREYYSEQSVMNRRKEAGLNTALSGSESATSGASASGSAGSLSSPIPMQVPQFGEIGNALSQAIGNYFNFKQLELQGAKVSADTAKVLQDTIQDKAMFEVSMRMQNTTWQNLLKTQEHLDLQNTELKNAIRIQRLHVNEVHNQFYNEWVTREMAKNNVKIEGGKFILMYEKDLENIKLNARNFANELKLRKTDTQFKYGGRSRFGSTFDQNNSNTEGSQWSINGKYHYGASASAGIAGFGNVGGNTGLEIGGNYSSSQQRTTAEMVGISSSSESTFANSEVGQILAKVEGALMTLEAPDLSDELKRHAIDILLRANYSFEAYQAYYAKLDRHSTSATPLLGAQ